MSVKIRLQRFGTKKRPFYRVVVMDSRTKRDGDVVEFVGRYQPIVKGKQFEVDEEKVLKWLKQGAQPTDTVKALLKKEGIWQKYSSAK
ncbi:MAG TPA: 30S ribosomal protein S16 [Spirochaetota bacterium]|nr:30S ribosomal protein S16 [Spirochaetota bacterium]OQA95675.1 MAG: 30S ribosomal protein S16 [Spirochaetes bacterium ADurb.Bin218]HON16996.1 30S ribosomal protein S16 [Spirochaetota bacterium]HOQ12326.1 30S ribosomal protein S16 [Spirochaetota bacterium]HOV09286.1 30S ribosomal protein S16 [Spirochaetota bacterium]